MIGKPVKAQEPVALAEVVEMLEKRKEYGELGYEQSTALEHAKKFSISKPKLEKIKKKLQELSLSKESVVKIIDIMPTSAVVVRHILSKEMGTFGEEDINKILSIVKEGK